MRNNFLLEIKTAFSLDAGFFNIDTARTERRGRNSLEKKEEKEEVEEEALICYLYITAP